MFRKKQSSEIHMIIIHIMPKSKTILLLKKQCPYIDVCFRSSQKSSSPFNNAPESLARDQSCPLLILMFISDLLQLSSSPVNNAPE